ncbi:MAG: hypothetical protein V3S48_03535 [Candidatus Neomarinimicrobiota bacterium]
MVEPEKLLNFFEDLAHKLDINLVHGKGNFSGGYCHVKNEKYIVINKIKPLQQRLRVLGQVFKGMDLKDIYMPPALRNYILDLDGSLFEGETG